MIILPTIEIKRTIWPYEEGYGILIKRLGYPDTVYCHGLSKEECQCIKEELQQLNKTELAKKIKSFCENVI